MKGGQNISYQSIFDKLKKDAGVNSNNTYYLSLESDKNATYWSGYKMAPNNYTNTAKNMIKYPKKYSQINGDRPILLMVVRSSEDEFQNVLLMRAQPLYYSETHGAFLVKKHY